MRISLDEANLEVWRTVQRKAAIAIWVANDGHLELGSHGGNGDKAIDLRTYWGSRCNRNKWLHVITDGDKGVSDAPIPLVWVNGCRRVIHWHEEHWVRRMFGGVRSSVLGVLLKCLWNSQRELFSRQQDKWIQSTRKAWASMTLLSRSTQSISRRVHEGRGRSGE